jgi:putative flippase GtrA
MKLALQYIFFAIIATAANFLTQALVTAVDPTRYKLWSALVCGTGAGLVVKYILDKQFIFQADHLSRPTDIGKSFFRYALTGLLTTAVFWGFELGFHHAFPTWSAAKYVGGAIGLAIGYVWKYQLDRRFTFATP